MNYFIFGLNDARANDTGRHSVVNTATIDSRDASSSLLDMLAYSRAIQITVPSLHVTDMTALQSEAESCTVMALVDVGLFVC